MKKMKTALVTGGNKGIGLEIARTLHDGGYTVYVVARDFSQFSLKADTIIPKVFDLEKVSDILTFVKSLKPIDVLVNNAGYMNALDITEYTLEEQERIFRVNLEAPIEFIRAVLPKMKEQEFGRIINIASVAGQTGHPDVWYGVTKAGLINATISLSHVLNGTGITINAVLPGPVDTSMMKYFSEERKNFLRKYVNVTGTYLDPKAVAEVVKWFAQERQSYLSGTCLEVNNCVSWFQ